MALQKCPECGGQLSTTARSCPHCGAQRVPKVALLFALIGILGALGVLGIGAAMVLATPQRQTTQEVQSLARQATEQLSIYVKRLRQQDAAAIADMFEQDGISVHEGQPPVVGREAIRKLLESFATYRVQTHTMSVDKTSEADAEVVQVGTFDQTVVSPEGKTIYANGSFTATWRRQSDGGLLLHSMRTAPLATRAN